jgi:hypothetical protein
MDIVIEILDLFYHCENGFCLSTNVSMLHRRTVIMVPDVIDLELTDLSSDDTNMMCVRMHQLSVIQ